MIRAPAIISTERLTLRAVSIRDARALTEAYASDPEATKYLTFRTHHDIRETKRFLRAAVSSWRKGTVFTWVITLRQTGLLIGAIDAHMDKTHVMLGYVLSREYWNRGYMSEAVVAVTEWALAQEEIYRVWAVCDVENIASACVLEKAGMQKEGTLRQWVVLPNRSKTPRDCFCYGKVKAPNEND